MKYGIIDTASLDAYALQSTDYRPSDVAQAVALAMPAVERSGVPYKRAQFTTGKTALYNAYGFDWAFNGLKARNDRELGYTSGTNKQNHEVGLTAAGLIERTGNPGKGGQYVFLTEAGVARCKAVDAELGKVAKGLTLAAYTKAVKAAEKAAKAAARAAGEFSGEMATEVPETAETEPVSTPEAFDHDDTVITADQVEAQLEHEANQ
jgi:hypothetical protein